MTEPRTQRVRDPVHGLIVFRDIKPLDQLAWALIGTPEFQRLRRIKQLGVSEFVFPGATHTRFSHSIGVFHTARALIEIVNRELPSIGQAPDPRRADVAVTAALLHDLGHGPFSHTFEAVQKARGVAKKHEKWTAEIIRNPDGAILPLLDAHWPDGGFADAVAELLEAEDPSDIYHAVVSSSFDADRLDYLRRDRMMTGTGAGAIDFDWLTEQVRVADVEIEAPEADEEQEPMRVATFCLDPKALPAAEQFLLARYTLHEQVYLHKTTRCIEHMISQLLRLVAERAQKLAGIRQTGLDKDHALIRFFGKDGATLATYLELDDVLIWGAIERMTRAPDSAIADLAKRLRERRLFKTLDLRAFGHDPGTQRMAARRIDDECAAKRESGTVIKDESATVSLYTQVGGDEEKTHKKLHILDPKKGPREISELSLVVRELAEQPKRFTRYYFADESDRDRARRQRSETG